MDDNRDDAPKALPERAEPPGRRQVDEAARERREQDALARLDQQIDEVEAYRMPLMEHLIELKDRLLKVIAALILGVCVGLWYARPVYEFLTAPFVAAASQTSTESKITAITLFGGIAVYFRIGIMVGFLLALPVIAWQFWAFVAPGLYRTERRLVGPLAFSSASLFVAGGAFAFYVMFPVAFPFFLTILPLEAMVSADDYLSSIMWMMAAFGICFQVPVGSFFLARLGLVDHRDMIAMGRFAIVAIFVVAAILTPTPDPVSQIILAVPMCVLYGAGIVVAKFFSTKKRD